MYIHTQEGSNGVQDHVRRNFVEIQVEIIIPGICARRAFIRDLYALITL